jgi:CheY-like chemotaxis protein
MKILIAEDDTDTSRSYKRVLEQRQHVVKIAVNGKECLDIYHEELRKITSTVNGITEHILPFDVVLLDYKMPDINGMEVAKEILTVSPHQRIIFASAYVKETLLESVKQLNQVVELLQKPFGSKILIDQIEDNEIYEELQKFNVDIQILKTANLSHEQLKNVLEILRKNQKGRTF